mmetsp:Transcript_8252/g.23249  ORF Transcript_8252/g.23249 Transcript_8252/m.23249 type:complete len:259 (-) Transcript_8252:8-784(-)
MRPLRRQLEPDQRKDGRPRWPRDLRLHRLQQPAGRLGRLRAAPVLRLRRGALPGLPAHLRLPLERGAAQDPRGQKQPRQRLRRGRAGPARRLARVPLPPGPPLPGPRAPQGSVQREERRPVGHDQAYGRPDPHHRPHALRRQVEPDQWQDGRPRGHHRRRLRGVRQLQGGRGRIRPAPLLRLCRPALPRRPAHLRVPFEPQDPEGGGLCEEGLGATRRATPATRGARGRRSSGGAPGHARAHFFFFAQFWWGRRRKTN